MIQLPASTSASPSPAPSAESPLGKHRKRVHSARKKMERVAHERAPGLSTMVAGHNYTYTFLNNAAGKAKNNKRYSASEYQHLVPDELGELHDPEYESIKIVTRKPSISTIGDAASDSEESSDLDESESEASSSRTGPMPGLGRSHPSYRYVPSYERYRNTSLNATSFGAQQPKTLQGFTTSLSAHHHSSSARSSRSNNSSASFNPNISSSSYTSNANGSFASSRLSATYRRPESTLTGNSGGRKSTRTYADAGVTYLAPSVTMPPTPLLSSSARTSSTGTGGTINCTGGAGGTYNPVRPLPRFRFRETG
jgi:hypothetical protein